jgi:hypothetical protein
LNATPLLLELGLDVAHHPKQARVVPHLAGLHPAAVIHLPGAVLGTAALVIMALARPLVRRQGVAIPEAIKAR